MPVLPSEIVQRLSGGTANTDPDAAIGGAKSATAAGTGAGALFRDVSTIEAAAGVTLYRCFYVENTNAADTASAVAAYIKTQSTSPDSVVEIGVGASGVNGSETAVADEFTAPAGVAFSAAADSASTALPLGNLPPGQHAALWYKLTVAPGAAFDPADTAEFVTAFIP